MRLEYTAHDYMRLHTFVNFKNIYIDQALYDIPSG